MAKLAVLGGNANPALTAEICEKLKIKQTEVLVGRFSEGEIRVHVRENIRGKDVFIVQPTCSPVNDNLMELLIIIDAVRRASADRITAVLPYYGYARQDRKDQPRVPITAKLVANIIVAAGANRVLTMDLHASQVQGFFDIPVDHLYAINILCEYFKEKQIKDLVVVSPDVGGIKMARAYAKRLNAGLAIVDKRRISTEKTEVMHILGDVKDKNVVMVDDIVATAGSLVEAVGGLKTFGAKGIYAAATHGVLSGPARERIDGCKELLELVVTNSIPLIDPQKSPKIKQLSVAPLLAEAILRTHNGESISSLFEEDPQLKKVKKGHIMEQINLDVKLRTELGSARVRRIREHSIPAIVYGGGSKPTTITADRKAYDRIHRQHMGESLIYRLNVLKEGKKVEDFPAIIKDIQFHPVTDEVIHLDFNRISLDKEIEIKIKIITTGEAIGVKRDGGTLDHLMWELDIICLPTNIPHHIETDITNLGIHDSIHVKDLKLPAGVRTKHDPESVVVAVAGSMREEGAAVVEADAAATGAEPEVLKEKKKEEGAAGAEGKKAEAPEEGREKIVKLIVGLGNPDAKYLWTRHNLGFMALQALAKKHDVAFRKSPVGEALAAKITIEQQVCSLLLPMTYMNNSGTAVKAVVSKNGIALEDILIVYDDMAVAFGNMRTRPEGSSGGHNGVQSIIDHLGTKDFARLRLGIGRPRPGAEAVDYVLSDFSPAEKKSLPDFINQALLCVHSWVTGGVEQAMNQYNQRKKNE